MSGVTSPPSHWATEQRSTRHTRAIKIARVCRVDRCSVAQWEGGEVTPLMAQYSDGRKTPDQWAAFQGMASRLLHEIPATARALDTRRPVVVNDARESDLVPREWVESF